MAKKKDGIIPVADSPIIVNKPAAGAKPRAINPIEATGTTKTRKMGPKANIPIKSVTAGTKLLSKTVASPKKRKK